MNGTNYITIGYNFLQLAINSIEVMDKKGNLSTLSMGGRLSNSDFWSKYEEFTKWNDSNIAIPILFNFFHGTELILKGLILYCGGKLENKTHKLSDLLNKLKNCPTPPSQNLFNLMDKIISDNGFEDFFKENNTSTDSFYEVFKYPEFRNGNEIKYWLVRGKDKDGLEKFIKIKDLGITIKFEIEKWLSI